MGAAYTALANDAYAATWNPAGLGFMDSPQAAAQHLSYLDALHYEYLSFGLPIPSADCPNESNCRRSSIGGSLQYLGTGDITGRDDTGQLTSPYSSYYSAYNLAYGRRFTDQLSLGITGKIIHAQIDDVSATAFGADIGSLYRWRHDLVFAATLNNMGSKLTFLNDGDPLPLAFHLGGAYQPSANWLVSSEVVVPQTGLASFHIGGEWHPVEMLALRSGFRTDTLSGLSFLAGYSLGIGLNVWGQEFSYAWVPYGELGNSHYFSLVLRWGEVERAKRNLIQFQHIKTHESVNNGAGSSGDSPDYQQLMELLNEGNKQPVAQDKKDNGSK